MKHVARLYVEDSLSVGGTLGLDVAQTHYLGRVMRLGEGAEVLVFNGRDGEMRCRIETLAGKSARLTVAEQTRAQTPRPSLTLAFAPVKKAAMDSIAEKATELGVGVLQPVMTEYTSVKQSRVNLARLRAHATEAAEQTGRLTVPEIHPPIPLEAICGAAIGGGGDSRHKESPHAESPLADSRAWRHIVFCDETAAAECPAGAHMTMAEAIGAMGETAMLKAGEAMILIGPEGGFSAGERAMLRAMPAAIAVGLGPNILRCDTAAIAALAIWQSLAGAWGNIRNESTKGD